MQLGRRGNRSIKVKTLWFRSCLSLTKLLFDLLCTRQNDSEPHEKKHQTSARAEMTADVDDYETFAVFAPIFRVARVSVLTLST